MSTFVKVAVTCRSCGSTVVRNVATSVNAIRSPWLREQVLDGSFQQEPCAACGAEQVHVLPFLYVDFRRKILVGVYPESDLDRWPEVEQEAAQAFERNVQESSADFARELAEDVRVRTVFGLAALREKVTTLEADLDDGAVEAVKLRLLLERDDIRRDADAPFHLLEAGEQELRFAVELATGDGWALDVVAAERSVYDDVAAGAAGELTDALRAGPFCDRRRLLAPSTAAVAR
jgi:hypothetical protein